ncbi:MAG: amidohydrolase [Oscillospiraceae bacterium]
MKILLKNANVIAHTGEVLSSCDIKIDGVTIIDIGKALQPDDGSEIMDCTDKFVTPTFVNMHTHSPMNIFKGIAEDVNIDDWFNKEIWPYESKMQDEDIYWGAKLAACEMLQNGISAFADHYFNSELIANACEETGIKADIAYTIFGFGGNCDKELALAKSFFEKYKSSVTISPRFGPHSPYICTPEVLKTVVDAAKECGSGIHIHVSETKVQVEESKKQHGGKTPFEVLNDAGGFDVPCIIGHGLWLEEGDIKFLKQDTCFAECPKTYMKLGMSKGPLWDLKDNLNITSGTDGAASSNSLDVLEQMRFFALIGKFNDKSESFTLKEIWHYLMNGHNYLRFNSGKVEIGYSADLNIWDLNTISTAPVYNPLASIIYSANAATNITDTIINGKFIKRHGKLTFDTTEVVKNASRCAKEIYKRGKGKSSLYF